jgi:hypothetical protein
MPNYTESSQILQASHEQDIGSNREIYNIKKISSVAVRKTCHIVILVTQIVETRFSCIRYPY